MDVIIKDWAMVTKLKIGLLLMVFSVLNVYGQEEQKKVVVSYDKDSTVIMTYCSIGGGEVDSILYFKKNGEVVKPNWAGTSDVLTEDFNYADMRLLWTKRFLLAVDMDEFNYTYYLFVLFENFELTEVRFMYTKHHYSKYDSVIEDVLKSTAGLWKLPSNNDYQSVILSVEFCCSIGQLISRGIHPPDDYYEDFEKHYENLRK